MIVVGHAADRRIAALQDARRACGLEPARVLDWRDLLDAPSRFVEAFDGRAGVPVKIDAAGGDMETSRRFVVRGWSVLGRAGRAPVATLDGEFVAVDAWHAGVMDLLAVLERDAQALAPRWFNTPSAIALMGDKLACQQHLVRHGIGVPPLLGAVDGYAALQALLDASGLDRVYVKACFGSSAVGVVAYQRNGRGAEVAISSARLVESDGREALVSTLKPQRLEDTRAIAALVDALARQGSYVEQWIPKPSLPGTRGLQVDQRVVVFGGEARQRVARVSTGPLTNLHLGNRRAAPCDVQSGDDAIAVHDAAGRAARTFAGANLVGLDLVVRRGRVHVLEANAFGDLLPGITWQGRSTYDDQAIWAQGEAAHA